MTLFRLAYGIFILVNVYGVIFSKDTTNFNSCVAAMFAFAVLCLIYKQNDDDKTKK